MHHRRALLAVLAAACVMANCNNRDAAPPASWQPDRSCSVDDDCQPAPSCCPEPCTGNVINRKDMDMAQRRVKANCSESERKLCPSAAACPNHIYACVRSKCALVMEGSPDWPKK